MSLLLALLAAVSAQDASQAATERAEPVLRQFCFRCHGNESQKADLNLEKAVKKGSGTLFDQSMIVYGSGISDGHEHGDEDLPTLIAGRGGGTIKPGRTLRYPENTSLSRLHLALLQRMGLKIDRLGETGSPLSDLEG